MYRESDKPLGTTSQSVIVDRLLAGLPHAHGPGAPAMRRPSHAAATHRPVASRPYYQTARFSRDPRRSEDTALGAWGRVLLGVLLGFAVTFWPYQMCGFPLAGYFVGTGTVMIAAFWAAATSWNRRAPVAHILSIGLLIWGMALTGDQLLQRSGYASAAAAWSCE